MIHRFEGKNRVEWFCKIVILSHFVDFRTILCLASILQLHSNIFLFCLLHGLITVRCFNCEAFLPDSLEVTIFLVYNNGFKLYCWKVLFKWPPVWKGLLDFRLFTEIYAKDHGCKYYLESIHACGHFQGLTHHVWLIYAHTNLSQRILFYSRCL